MNLLKKRHSSLVLNILIAIVITLTVNFSYLLSIIVDQRETTGGPQQEPEVVVVVQARPEVRGELHLSKDGYGYILCDTLINTPRGERHLDSIFVSNRKARWYNLCDGDQIVCNFFPPRGDANPQLDKVLVQNGNEIPAPVIYDRPKRNQDMAVQIFYYFALTFILLSIMTVKLNMHKPNKRTRYKQRALAVIAVTVACYFIAPFTNWQTGKVMMIFQMKPMMMDWMVILKCIVVLVVAILYGRIYTLLFEQRKILSENEQLRSENLQNQYNMLMGQISPHFFFNSLNSLSMLVRGKDEQKALEYIDQLSYTFRYIIQNGQNTKSKLQDEMEFARAYGELFKVRYADKLFFDVDVDERYNEWLLPALTLQPLIGNAVKHNTITRKHPFHISIRTEGSTLVVSNLKSPKLEPEPSTGIGLKNLSSRWRLIAGTDIEIIDSEKEFIVKLPLQNPSEA
ncbi:MAG: histidine kinase [Alistipes sp.]|nr:histidine kinase [Alistipes sp.]